MSSQETCVREQLPRDSIGLAKMVLMPLFMFAMACHNEASGSERQSGGAAQHERQGAATSTQNATLPDLGALSRLSTGPMAGIATNAARLAIKNPYAGQGAAIQDGERLYVHMNCAYCHGFQGQGGMGPNLADDYWRFGGDDADVFKSIFEGRGRGMPAWGAALTENDIWKLVAYIRTLHEGPGGPGGSREPMRSRNEHER